MQTNKGKVRFNSIPIVTSWHPSMTFTSPIRLDSTTTIGCFKKVFYLSVLHFVRRFLPPCRKRKLNTIISIAGLWEGTITNPRLKRESTRQVCDRRRWHWAKPNAHQHLRQQCQASSADSTYNQKYAVIFTRSESSYLFSFKNLPCCLSA